jgi:EmrB/QacA subfamily drug resistance transporter
MNEEALPEVHKGIDPRWIPLAVTTAGTFMSVLDNNIINVALPTILQHFDASLGQGQLVVTSYVMALAVVIPMSGFLGERIGMKRLYMFVLAAFATGSALCGLAWSIESLIAFRVLQGLGGGMLQPLGMAIIFSMITPQERARFVAILGMPVLLGPLIGPALGGYLVEFVGWRSVFFINVPVGVVNVLLAYRILKETPVKAETRLDVWGVTFASLAFPCLLFAASRGTEIGWTSPPIVLLVLVGGTSFALFVRHELRHHDPLLNLRLYKVPMFRLAMFVQWVGIFSLFGLNVIIPLYLQRVHEMSASEAGQMLIPMGVVAFVTMNICGKFYARLGPRPIIMSGLLVMSVSTFLWSLTEPGTNNLILLVLVSLRGLGLGMFGQFVQIVAYNTVRAEDMPRATSLVTTGQRLTTAFSTAILSSVLIVGLSLTDAPAGTSIAAGTAPLDDQQMAFRYAFLLMTALSVVGVVLASRLRDTALEPDRPRPVAGASIPRATQAAAPQASEGGSSS